MRIKENSMNHIFLNWSGEHIAGCMIHLIKISQMKEKQHKIGAN